MTVMPIRARKWLPPGSLDGAALALALTATLDAWAAAWFARTGVTPSALASGEALAVPADGQWFDSGAGLALAIPGTARDAMLAMLFGTPPGGDGPVDADILARLLRDCLDDLGRRLATSCGLPPETRWALRDGRRAPDIAAPHGVALRCAGSATPLRLVISDDLATVLRKGVLPPRAPLPPPRPIAEALAGQRIAVAAALGSCRLTLGDVAGLGVGDVLVLDTPTAAPLALAIDDTVAAPALWSVSEGDDRLQLTLLASVPRMIR